MSMTATHSQVGLPEHRCRYFFHFAALVPVTAVESDPVLAFQTNVVGTFNVCKQLLATQKNCWLFQCSSSHVYEPAADSRPIAEDAPTRAADLLWRHQVGGRKSSRNPDEQARMRPTALGASSALRMSVRRPRTWFRT